MATSNQTHFKIRKNHSKDQKYKRKIINLIRLDIILLAHLYNGKSIRQWPGKPGFNPRLTHTKISKNGTWCLFAKHGTDQE